MGVNAIVCQSVIAELSATTTKVGEQIEIEEIAALQRQVSHLKNYVVVLALLWVGTIGVWFMKTSPYVAEPLSRKASQ